MMKTEKLKDLVGLPASDASKDPVLDMCLAVTEEAICNYCSVDELPAGLLQTAYRMAAELYSREYASGAGNVAVGDVTGIKVGDTQVTYGSAGGSAEQYTAGILKNYERTLQRYRKVRWDR